MHNDEFGLYTRTNADGGLSLYGVRGYICDAEENPVYTIVILEESAGLMDGVSTREEAEAAAAQSLPRLQAAAEDEIRQAGYGYSVQAEITRMYFPTRHYESVTLPAGEYDALRISIGEAKGKNWWCVLFPALCLPVAENGAQLSDVLSSSQLDVVQGNYEIRFKAVEWYEQLKDWLENLGGNG